MVSLDISFEEFLALFRDVVAQLSLEERWQLLRELAREDGADRP
jgi:hypothetical protein